MVLVGITNCEMYIIWLYYFGGVGTVLDVVTDREKKKVSKLFDRLSL